MEKKKGGRGKEGTKTFPQVYRLDKKVVKKMPE